MSHSFFGFSQVRLYAPQEQIDQVEYASKITDDLFTFYEEYFQIKYALPKAGEYEWQCIFVYRKLIKLDMDLAFRSFLRMLKTTEISDK